MIGLLLSLGGMSTANPQPHNAIQRALYSLANRISTVFDPPPPAGIPTVGVADPVTGVVTGSLGFPTDAGLTFTATQPTAGVVTLTGDGRFTYTPTQQARQAAGLTTTDTFTATAHQGLSSTTVTVTVTVDPGVPTAGAVTVGDPDTSTGQVSGSATFTDTAGRDLTYTVSVATAATVSYDPATGAFTYTPTDLQRQAVTDTTTT
ncbi:MAG: VCBS domain-containing protein, partial [Mycobacterium sp.]|nr:VCBS domain-containing protein [Mycobacterium sp.]